MDRELTLHFICNSYYPFAQQPSKAARSPLLMSPVYKILKSKTKFQNKTAHDELIGFLLAELGEFIAPDWLGWRVTPNELWRKNKTLIISYAHDPSSAFNGLIWPEVKHVWANKAKENELKDYLQGERAFRYIGGS